MALAPGEALGEIVRRARRNRLKAYRPYPRQYEFHAAGRSFAERLLMAGNQVGKTFSAAMEFAMHLTGHYPDWWDGVRFDHAILAWVGAETTEATREVVQSALLGEGVASEKDAECGTGAIPGDAIARITKRQAGVTDVADQIIVRHASGQYSRAVLKNYSQGREVWQGKKVHVVWLDEEPDQPIYSEALTRIQAVPDGRLMMTFSPLKGGTSVVASYLDPQPGSSPKSVTTMTIYDAVGGIWGEDTPWAGTPWKGHYTAEGAKEKIARYPAWERDTRAFGLPMAGEGRVYQVAEEDIKIAPFEIPRHYKRGVGIDFGYDHPFAAVWMAWDVDGDTLYVYDCYRVRGQLPPTHASAIKKRGAWIPVFWPHDGDSTEKGGGQTTKDLYIAEGVNMFPYSARVKDEIGGAQRLNAPTEPITMDLHERMLDGRFKVFANLSDWFNEFRMYHRKGGKIVAMADDLMSATRYAAMMKRHFRWETSGKIVRRPAAVGLRQWA